MDKPMSDKLLPCCRALDLPTILSAGSNREQA